MAFEDPHQHSISMIEIVALAFKPICPFFAVEKVVSEAPNYQQHDNNPVARGVIGAADHISNEAGHVGFA